jgi:hypothetical protein
MFTTRTQNNDGARSTKKNHEDKDVKNVLTAAFEKLDMPETIRNHPYSAVAIASGVGMAVGLTLGSKLVRIIVGSVGMYTLSELLRRYAQATLDEMKKSETLS